MIATVEWNDADWQKFQTWIKGMLHQGEVAITFTKKDGTTRVLRGTLNPELLPKIEIKEEAIKTERKKSDTSLAVYDLEAKAWRSFTYKSVTNVSLIL